MVEELAEFSLWSSIQGKGWGGKMMISTYENYKHVHVEIRADTKDIAQAALDHIYDILAAGRTRFVRTSPRVAESQEMRSGAQFTTVIKGHLRFSFRCEAGDETKLKLPPFDDRFPTGFEQTTDAATVTQ